ncbi:BON domain-containing protein [Magnetospirillum molischianum]|uniref:Predicted periplasmic or secreted lipoprotein n=1 Tax=Magnetospirillum molischianum DSM 120 TaxID=1150626 RepID=H8FTM2_MAGML|nr:BON domain-containing protein [Magnetospirillum molischianum]CCG41710.1 Predicted periplasmic or secreted lipoprotein [Magnetospirillum molischianum DSM 120]
MPLSRPLPIILAATALAGLLSGCIPVLIGAGATTGVAAAEERGMGGSIDDLKIRTEINHKWFERDVEMYRKVTLNISEGRVMLTGVVPTEKNRNDAAELVGQVAGVREVMNEIVVRGDDEPGGSSSSDVWIQQKLKTRLLGDSEIRNINYVVDVSDAVVYILGIAQNDTELERVIAHARDINGVRRVISHIRLKNDPRRAGG